MKFVEVVDMTVYMKSGNSFVLDSMTVDFTIEYKDNEVTAIRKVNQIRPKNRLYIASICLNQIEAIVTGKIYKKLVY